MPRAPRLVDGESSIFVRNRDQSCSEFKLTIDECFVEQLTLWSAGCVERNGPGWVTAGVHALR